MPCASAGPAISGLDAVLARALYFDNRFAPSNIWFRCREQSTFAIATSSLPPLPVRIARMKAEHRHELQSNVLADWLATSADKVKPYSSLITVAIAVLAIGVGIFAYLRSTDERGKAEASQQLIEALQGGVGGLQEVAANYRGTEPALVAQLLVAEAQLDSGADALYTNKPAARTNLSTAAEAFSMAKDEAKDPMLRAWALYGLGRAHESLGDLDRARGDYQALLKEYPDSGLAGAARKNLDHLNQPGVKEFYDWFAKQDPRPAAVDTGSGLPGVKPSFDLKEPSGIGDMKLPSATDANFPIAPTPDLPAVPLPDTSKTAPADAPPADSK